MTHADDILAELDLDPNEASGLLRIGNDAVLDNLGWDRGYWTVLDEVDAAECVVMLGHVAGAELSEGWAVEALDAVRIGDEDAAMDAEAVAAWDGQVYVFGSHHGHKGGPLRRDVQWVGRFAEADVLRGGSTKLTVASDAFGLHRLVNDALRNGGIAVQPMRERTRAAFIDATLGELRGTAEEDRVRVGDWTINIEGAAFTGDGSLLLGLRFPVSMEGRPLLVQLRQWERLFDEPHGLPEVAAIWQVDAVGRNGAAAGVRDLCVVGDELHIVTGDLDSAGKGSVIRDDYPEGTQTVSTHFVTTLRASRTGVLPATVVKEFPDNPRIEGIAADTDGRFFYVSDEDEYISVRSTPLLTSAG